ncbi:hypothetical protein ERJ75_000878100 [Trypanosoma vivax]|nr:hypothetical protein ERJ75_000878100 [Trypanosoma vivax]
MGMQQSQGILQRGNAVSPNASGTRYPDVSLVGSAMVNDQMGLQQSQGILQRGNAVSPNASGTRYPDVSLVGSAMVNDQMGMQQSQGILQRGNAVSPNASGTRYPDVSLVGSAMVNDQMGLQQSQGILQRGNAVSPNASGTRYPDVSLVGSAMVNDQMGMQQSQGILQRGNAVSPNASGTRYPDVSLVGSAMVNDQMGMQQSQGILQRGNAVSPNASGTRYPDVSLVGSAMVNDQMGLQQSQGILQRGNAVSPNSGGAKYLPSLSDEDELSPLKDCSPVVLPVSGPTRASKAPVCAPSGELPSTRSDAEKDALVTSVDGTTLPPPPTLLQTHKPRGIPDAPNASTGGELFLDLKFDRDGRAIVPVNYKRGVYYPPKLLIGLEEDSSTDVGVMLGFRSASDNFVPTQVAVQQKSAPVVNLKIIGVSGLPYNSACARIVVYLLNYIDFRTSQETNKRNDPHIFLRPPASVIYQSVNEDNNMLLNIYVDLHGIIVTDDTCALVVIEYITAPEADITVFGHACLPIGKKALAGNFLSRVRCGDPRQPWARTCVSHSEEDSASFARRRELNFTQEEAESILDAEALFIKAFSPPSSRIECIPCSFLSWTLNSDPNGPYFEFPGEPRMSNGEALLFSVRFALKVGAPKTEDEMGTLIQAFGNEKDVLPYSFTYAAPYDPRRGLFIRTDMLYGMGPSNALYTVVTALDAGERRIFFCTRKFHFTSDVGLPQFDDSVNITTKILPLQQTMAVYHILRICNLETIREYGETRLTVEQIGWSVLKLFPESGVLRNGRYALAIFDGKPPENLFRRLKERPMETTFRELIASREIRYLKPCATVVVDVGDPLFIGQITVKHPGRPETTKLMTSAALAAQYPSAGNSGSVGQEQQMMLRNMGLDPEKVQSAVNIATRGFVEQNMLTKEIAATLDKRSSGHKRRNK